MELFKYRIVKEKSEVYFDGRKSLTNPDLIHEILEDYYNQNFDMDKEHFSVMMLDTKNKIIGVSLVSIGTLNQALVHPREVFRPAVMAAANSVILCHNHPSGSVKPSEEDISITSRLIEAGRYIGINVLDHIILGDTNYLSFKKERYM